MMATKQPASTSTSWLRDYIEKIFVTRLVILGKCRTFAPCADWSYIPGGVISGTALIRPDFPELLTFPFLWQQTEYVLGGGSSHYMFLVLAAQSFLNK